jgi:hypothetical protein
MHSSIENSVRIQNSAHSSNSACSSNSAAAKSFNSNQRSKSPLFSN